MAGSNLNASFSEVNKVIVDWRKQWTTNVKVNYSRE